VRLTNQTTTGYRNNYSPLSTGPNCTGYGETGLDRVYKVTVPNGNTLQADVTSISGNPAIYVLTAAQCIPQPTACLAGDDNDGAPDERAVWLNNTGSAQTVYVVVDSYYGSPITYNLNISF
jgi:hypothetical protein